MIFTKDIEKISYEDIISFCGQQIRENINLDYKQDIDSSLAKTIAAMANTWGGLIIIGVEEEDSRPRLPVNGIPYNEHIRERINNIILGNITPPIFIGVQVCQSADQQKALIVIRVPQSNMSPHGIRGNTKVYIRTDTSNEPEELASIDRILWLVNRRNKSSELKIKFSQRAYERFDNLCFKAGVKIEHSDFTISICPLYPFEILTDYRNLQRDIPRAIGVNGWGHIFPLCMMSHSEFHPTYEGVYAFFVNETTKYLYYEEINLYGFFYHREDLGNSKRTEDGNSIQFAYLYSVLERVDMFIESMSKLYQELKYWGLLELRIVLDKIDKVDFRDLPVPRGIYRFEKYTSSQIDNRLEFSKLLMFQELKNSRVSLVAGMMEEISWAMGFSHIGAETITKLMEEKKRL